VKHLFRAAALVAVLVVSGVARAADGDVAKPAAGPWGFDLAGRDTGVAPGADFYRYANGTYLKTLTIPPDRSRYGTFDLLRALSETRMHDLLEDAAAHAEVSADEALIAAFYKAAMDEGAADALGTRPLKAELWAVRAAKSRADLAALMGRSNASFFGTLFDIGIQNDAKSPNRYAVYLGQDGLGLPDRDYYLEPSFAAKKAAYLAYVGQTLKAAGWPDADARAAAIVALEDKVAAASWTKTEQRDPVRRYNPMTPAELAAFAPDFPWSAYFEGAGVSSIKRVIVGEKSAFPKLAALFAQTPLPTLKAWAAFKVTDSASPYLSKPFVDASFEFRDKTLHGQPEQKPRWRRAAALLNESIGEAVGKAYVARYFPPQSKAKVEGLIDDLRSALAARIQRVDWMSDATKAKALEKLSMLSVKVGYPVKWRDYAALQVSPTDLYGDVERAQAFEWNRQVKRLDKPVDRTEWDMTPQTVNAYYNPLQNEIVFPAAILQPPFFDPAADMAVNYGAIGGVIGHEMTHGFDDKGRQFDGAGMLTDWWTADDAAKFVVQTKRLGAQYSAFEPIKGAHVNGELTMGENIADLGGLLLGLDAYRLSLKGAPAPVLDGFSGDQRVFFGSAQVWRGAIRDDALRNQLVTDRHSPMHERVDGVVRNIDAWYDAFGIKPGDPMYLAPDQRVRIW